MPLTHIQIGDGESISVYRYAGRDVVILSEVSVSMGENKSWGYYQLGRLKGASQSEVLEGKSLVDFILENPRNNSKSPIRVADIPAVVSICAIKNLKLTQVSATRTISAHPHTKVTEHLAEDLERKGSVHTKRWGQAHGYAPMHVTAATKALLTDGIARKVGQYKLVEVKRKEPKKPKKSEIDRLKARLRIESDRAIQAEGRLAECQIMRDRFAAEVKALKGRDSEREAKTHFAREVDRWMNRAKLAESSASEQVARLAQATGRLAQLEATLSVDGSLPDEAQLAHNIRRVGELEMLVEHLRGEVKQAYQLMEEDDAEARENHENQLSELTRMLQEREAQLEAANGLADLVGPLRGQLKSAREELACSVGHPGTAPAFARVVEAIKAMSLLERAAEKDMFWLYCEQSLGLTLPKTWGGSLNG